MRYAEETFEEAYPDAEQFILNNHTEINTDIAEPLDVDLKTYEEASKIGLLKVFTARDEKGQLVGYSAIWIHQSLHFRGEKHATQDVFYVRPEYRGKMVGFILIRFAETVLRKLGVKVINHHAHVHNLRLGVMLEKMGYTPKAYNYLKRL